MKTPSAGPRGPLEREARAVLRESGQSIARLESQCARAVAAAAEAVISSLGSGGTIYFCGNGGSAADAQHLACELAGRYLLDRPALAATALTTNSSSLTAIGNDFGFDQVFARQLRGVGTPGDVLVAITTSGRSENVLRAVEAAHELGMTVIGMTGLPGKRFAARCDHALVTPSVSTPRIQEGHIAMGHAFCELAERALFPARAKGGAGSVKKASGARGARNGAKRAARPGSSRRSRRAPRRTRRKASAR
jgi:D-sedoheptulose 7-phosphate isomerase